MSKGIILRGGFAFLVDVLGWKLIKQGVKISQEKFLEIIRRSPMKRGKGPVRLQAVIKDEMVTVVCGTRKVRERLAGYTVAEIRAAFGVMLQIPSEAVAVLAGQYVAPSDERQTPVGPGTIVEYVRPPGSRAREGFSQ